MNTKISLLSSRLMQPIVLLLLLSVLILISTGSDVKGQIGGDTFPSAKVATAIEPVNAGEALVSEGPGFIMVSPFDFKPLHPTYSWDYEAKSLYNPSTSFSEYVAGLTLPHGATITKMTMYFKDNASGTADMVLYLFRGGNDTIENQLAYCVSTSYENIFRTVSTTSINEPKIDNQNFSYHLHAVFPGNVGKAMLLTNVRIDYAYIVSTPLVMK